MSYWKNWKSSSTLARNNSKKKFAVFEIKFQTIHLRVVLLMETKKKGLRKNHKQVSKLCTLPRFNRNKLQQVIGTCITEPILEVSNYIVGINFSEVNYISHRTRLQSLRLGKYEKVMITILIYEYFYAKTQSKSVSRLLDDEYKVCETTEEHDSLTGRIL